jgi:hypothetical protein
MLVSVFRIGLGIVSVLVDESVQVSTGHLVPTHQSPLGKARYRSFLASRLATSSTRVHFALLALITTKHAVLMTLTNGTFLLTCPDQFT